ncbi:MAG: ABC transporter ATP-binding protein [Acidimicrobiia bacterium]|nr:MAG: ABC transporter ATP-binding protein [Acidimicrobiia bacterium]
MPRPLFEVKDLRVAVFDQERSMRDQPGPVTDAGEGLSSGWVDVVPGISFSVLPGEVLALVGESASGKSLALMGGFSLLSPGARVIGGKTRFRDVTFHPDGSDPSDGSKKSQRRRRKQSRTAGTVVADYRNPAWAEAVGTDIGFMFQNPIGSWTPDHFIGAQAGEALAEHSDLTVDEIEERVLDALGEVKLPKSRRLLGAYRHELSRGMAQRAMLAAALTKAPSLLIADEPLNGLDPPVAAAIMDLVKDMQKKRNMAMVVVTHDLAAVASLADRVAVVYGGVIIEEGPVIEIYHRPKHPYTSGLIGSIPGVRDGRLSFIPGDAQRLVDIDRSGCVFANRCTLVSDICTTVPPESRVLGETSVACHHAESAGLPGLGTSRP